MVRLIDADAINYDDYWWNKGYSARDCQQAAKLISEQPTIDAINARWIPVTERLPEKLGHYIITVRFNGEIFITADDYFSYGWDDWGDYVLAWLETDLKPYEGKEHDQTD